MEFLDAAIATQDIVLMNIILVSAKDHWEFYQIQDKVRKSSSLYDKFKQQVKELIDKNEYNQFQKLKVRRPTGAAFSVVKGNEFEKMLKLVKKDLFGTMFTKDSVGKLLIDLKEMQHYHKVHYKHLTNHQKHEYTKLLRKVDKMLHNFAKKQQVKQDMLDAENDNSSESEIDNDEESQSESDDSEDSYHESKSSSDEIKYESGIFTTTQKTSGPLTTAAKTPSKLKQYI